RAPLVNDQALGVPGHPGGAQGGPGQDRRDGSAHTQCHHCPTLPVEDRETRSRSTSEVYPTWLCREKLFIIKSIVVIVVYRVTPSLHSERGLKGERRAVDHHRSDRGVRRVGPARQPSSRGRGAAHHRA